MADATRKLLSHALSLSENERAELASELIASLDGDTDAGWQEAWLSELDRRTEAAEKRGETGSAWRAARRRILDRLATR